MKFFDQFPKVQYDIARKQYSNYENVTNIFFRLRIVREAINNIAAYYEYLVRDGDTPEILADKIYGDPEAHWVILLANEIVDVHYDWPLVTRDFQNYIVDKYGSIAAAKTTYHHYEKVITREESLTGLTTETRFVINQTKLTDNVLDVPYDYYTGLAEEQSVETFNLSDGHTVVQISRREAVSNYDYEYQKNENRRNIKIIKPEYYGQIQLEFKKITQYASEPFRRRLL
jgi:hypothetical protein